MKNRKYIAMPCGGKGICGKCRIKITKGTVEINNRDKKFLTEEEIKNGIRIACGHNLSDSVEYIPESEDFEIVSTYNINQPLKKHSEPAIIIDAGTTTLCFQLLDNLSEPIKTITKANSQRAFGADVISRISKASAGGFSQLVEILKDDIKKGISQLTEALEITPKKIYIAGNTTMTYFLRNMDCRGLGAYPFENNADDIFTKDSKSFFGKTFPFSAEVIIVPCISAFIGGDIVSGAYFLNIDKEENSIFIDIGTNGEILLNTKGELFSVSAAAGPAFEGGGISCGAGGIQGAINKIKYTNNLFEYSTIGNKKAIGICGSAIIDLIAELIENNIIDSTGLLNEKYFSTGIKIEEGIFLKQKDIRQIQLAKSAIISGIYSILSFCGIQPSEIEKVFIGGGFGFHLNEKNIFKIKMLPREFSGKITFCGNTCLGGLAKIHNEDIKEVTKFIEKTKSLNIAEQESFEKLFIENLNF